MYQPQEDNSKIKELPEESKEPPKTPAGQLKIIESQTGPGQRPKRKKARENLQPPLSQTELESVIMDIEYQLKEQDGINEEFLDAIANEYSLTNFKDRLKRLVRHLTQGESTEEELPDYPAEPPLENYPQLTKISSYECKKNIIDWIKDCIEGNQLKPTNLGRIQFKKKYGLQTEQELLNYEASFKKFQCITFQAEDLFEQEKEKIIEFLNKGEKLLNISSETLVHVNLLWHIRKSLKKPKRLRRPVSLIPPLNQQGLNELKADVEFQLKGDQFNQQFIDELANTYSLNEVKDKLDRYIRKNYLNGGDSCDSFVSDDNIIVPEPIDQEPPKATNYPKLPKIGQYDQKKNILDWIESNQLEPTNLGRMQFKRKYGLQTEEQLFEFKACFNEFQCITFEESELLLEERQVIINSLNNGEKLRDICLKTLVHENLIWHIRKCLEKSLPSPEPIRIRRPVSLIPPLDEKQFNELKSDVEVQIKENEIDEEFIDELAKMYSLNGVRDKLKRYIRKHYQNGGDSCDSFEIFIPKPNLSEPIDKEPQIAINYPNLPKIGSYNCKKNIIDWIVDNQIQPTNLGKMQFKKKYGLETEEQLQEFKACFIKFQSITFQADYLLEEERKTIFESLGKAQSLYEIASITLVHPHLVWELKYQQNLKPIPILSDPPKSLIVPVKPIIVADTPKPLIFPAKPSIVADPPKPLIVPVKPSIVKEKLSLRPPLNEQEQIKVDEDIIETLKDPKETKDSLIDYLLNTYDKLKAIKTQVTDYVYSFDDQLIIIDSEIIFDNLIQIKDYAKKFKIIDLLKRKESIPSNKKCTEEYGLNQDQLRDFQKCYEKNRAITSKMENILPEEKDFIFKIFIKEKNFEAVQNETLITIGLVSQIFALWQEKLRKESKLINTLNSYGSSDQSSESTDYVKLILNDNYEKIVQVLLKIYKKSKIQYLEVTQILRDYTIKFENCELENFIRIVRADDLLNNEQKQKELQKILDYFLENDIIEYLMILHELWIKGEQKVLSSYTEQVILQDKHLKIIPAIAQLLIIDKNKNLRTEVAEKRVFIDHKNEQAELERELEEKLKDSMKHEENKQDEQMGSEQDQNLVDTIKVLTNITKKKIKVHLMSQLKHSVEYTPEHEEMSQSTLLLVIDKLDKTFHVMISYENEQKLIDYVQLLDLKKKLPFLSNHLPEWLEAFIQLPTLRGVLTIVQDVNQPTERQRVLTLLESISKLQNEIILIKDIQNNKKKLQKLALQLWYIDKQLLQEWYDLQLQNQKMHGFCDYMITYSARQNSYWAFSQVSNLQKYFPMGALKLDLKDFNRVQTRTELNDRRNKMEELKDNPEDLVKFIINTLFGYILRKEDLSVIQSELSQVIKNSPISLRFLIAFLIQSADMGLRARLSHYLCQNKAVPLIMNCQLTYREQKLNMKYNQELVFTMENCEGVGVLSYGIGKSATFPCGKSEISNMIVTPKFLNKSFDTNDMNVLSNGQIDIFFEKCYQKKNGWAFMDGQGQVPNKNLKSILPLTNIVLVHFFIEDATDTQSVRDLTETLQLIKEIDGQIKVCLILRDCSETKEVDKSDYAKWLPMTIQIDKLITLVDLNQVEQQKKLNEIEKILLYFNTEVREIHQKDPKKQKFTKERFLEYFCKSDEQGQETFQRINEILKLSSDFLKDVEQLDSNVFNDQGLPSLRIKDQIRSVNLKLRSFTTIKGENQQTAVKREADLVEQLKQLNNTLQELEINTLMQKFWQIVNHDDAVLIKIELSKGLVNFTQKNTFKLLEQKNLLIRANESRTTQNQEQQTNELIQDANSKFQAEIKKIEEEIFERSLSYEYFWRSLICVMIDSKKCTYWSDQVKKLHFTKKIKEQMLDGDTFELVDGRNLEMKGDIIRQILGNEIESTKCIVACVIGPQSTGKSTLMNFCFGTQFLASTGRCTQGIYFTLQRIPPEFKEGRDVEYLIILDTEGLNSPERAEPEYDRKIVMFTLLCSDFLIINSRGDMTYQMKELIKICAVRYDQLRGETKVPKILYTFVQNSDTRPDNFITQISSLKSEMIACSNSDTVQTTADEMMSVHDDLVKVLGNAYVQNLQERDDKKGLFEQTYINSCSELFGNESSKVWQEVQKLFRKKDGQFRQIGTWLQKAQEHWYLIERHGASLIEHENVIGLKNDTRMKDFFSKLWMQYSNTKISEKDNIKAKENSQKIFENFNAGNDLNKEKIKFIALNDEEKSQDFQKMWDQFEKWKKEPNQSTLTQELETKHRQELNKKMDVLKENFALLLENKLKEIQMMQIHNNGIDNLFKIARDISFQINITAQQDQKEKLINENFESCWQEVMKELSGIDQIEKLRFTNQEYLFTTFKSVNNFMKVLAPHEYKKILVAVEKEDICEKSGLPKKLVELMVKHIKQDAFINENFELDCKDMFKFDSQILSLLKDPSERIFVQEKDEFLPLQNLVKVNYSYEILDDLLTSLNASNFYEQIKQMLQLVISREEKTVWIDIFRIKIENKKVITEDNQVEIIKQVSSLFQDFGQAGFGLMQLKHRHSKEFTFILLSDVNVEEELNTYKIFNNPYQKTQWLKELKTRIQWDKYAKIKITSKVQNILQFKKVSFANQLHPKIDFEDHVKQSPEMQKSMWCNNKPTLSYVFSKNNTKGKINVDKLLNDNNCFFLSEQYFQCLINPVKYEMAESMKWNYLAELARMNVDWEKIVYTINEKVSTEIVQYKTDPQSQNTNLSNDEFDMKNLLERNQISLEQANRIYISKLQGIQQQLDDELHSKLALSVHQTLSGVITWVACVIIWYRCQKNILTKFNEQQKKLESQKDTHKKNFKDIAMGVTATVTIQGAKQIFNETFKIFNEICKTLTLKNTEEFLASSRVQEQLDTDHVYDYLDASYISSANADEYEKFIGYVQEPEKAFKSYVIGLTKAIVLTVEVEQSKFYKDRVYANLNALKKRLTLVSSKIQRNQSWGEPVNLFDILKVGENVPLVYQEKKKIESELSPIYLSTLGLILKGDFTIGSQKVTLQVNKVQTEFIFTTKEKNQQQNEMGSPLQDLQKLQFEQGNNNEFIDTFLMRLGLLEKNVGLCSDLKVMIENLIILVDQKITEIDSLPFNDICDIKQQIESLQNNAIGCCALCKFCKRKCELKPHNDNVENGGTPHSCNKRGHQLRVFAGGCLETSFNLKYPSLMTCDEIKGSTDIQINSQKGTETRRWDEILKSMNRNWETKYTKEVNNMINPTWSSMHAKLEAFWKVLGKQFCQKNKYEYILPEESHQFSKNGVSEMNQKSIVIICLDDSGSMFAKNDFAQAVAGGKEVEQYLKNNHKNQSQVHIQLWYNDCLGVSQVYQGQLNQTIPPQAWVRVGCQTDSEIRNGLRSNSGFNYGSIGQFAGVLRILNEEVRNLLIKDSSYKKVYWFMFSDGGNSYPQDELDKLKKTFQANPKEWTGSSGACSKLTPMIITNQPEVKTLVEMSNKMNQISKEVWGKENFCQLRQNVKIEKLAETMIEQFTLN